ncbi:glycosyltransferase family 2 protein [Patescibacteria group bacterium]|nr:glycosyltransferase family 2 protein [Patescibacteria group bacterium]
MTTSLRFISSPSAATRADLGVVIVSYNVSELLRANLTSLFASVGEGSVQVVVVDNASRDDSAKMVQAEFPQVELIANKHNAGFASAVNQGIAACHARHILLLNPDMHLDTDSLAKTIAYADRVQGDHVAVIGGQLRTQEGNTVMTVRRFPDFWSQLAIILKLPHFFPNLSVIKKYYQSDLDYTKDQDVDSVRGSYFIITELAREVLGVLDTRYFIWFEEVDYCKGAISQGWKVRYAPELKALDYVGRSFQQTTRTWAQVQFTRSLVTYFSKWHSPTEARVLALVRLLGISLNWCLDRFRSLTRKSIGINPTAKRS